MLNNTHSTLDHQTGRLRGHTVHFQSTLAGMGVHDSQLTGSSAVQVKKCQLKLREREISDVNFKRQSMKSFILRLYSKVYL